MKKWEDLYATVEKEYDFLKPFDITLNESSTDSFHTTEDTSTYTDNNSKQGFNSSEFVPTDKTSGTRSKSYSRQNPKSRDYTRKGNIGNTSLSELVIKEREKAMFNLREIIYNDIVDFLCRGTYYE